MIPLVIEDHFKLPVEKVFKIGKNEIEVPLKYKCVSANIVIPIRTKKLGRLFESSGLRPLEIIPGIGLLSLTFFDFTSAPIPLFTEMTLSIPAVRNNEFTIPLYSVIKKFILKKINFYVVTIAQSKQEAIDHGNLITGYPHFPRLIDVKIKKEGDLISIIATGDDREIIDVKLVSKKQKQLKQDSYVTYVRKGINMHTIIMETKGYLFKAKLKSLKIGEHELGSLVNGYSPFAICLDARYYSDMIKIIHESKQEYVI